MDLRKLKTLIDLVQQSGIAELEITEGEERVRISRGIPTAMGPAVQPGTVYVTAPAAGALLQGDPGAQANGAAAESADPALPEGHVLKSPMVGTFYRAPSPGAPPFVEVGSAVESGTQVCIIEVMKLMNSVVAGVRGVVAEVCAQNGAPVQYGDVLFRVQAHA